LLLPGQFRLTGVLNFPIDFRFITVYSGVMIAVCILGSAILAGLNVVVWSMVACALRMLFSREMVYSSFPSLQPTQAVQLKTSWLGCIFVVAVGFGVALWLLSARQYFV
jgi:hypothetical protein